MLIVQKYGGSSLASPKHIQRAAKRIREVKAQGHDLVVVVSAMGHMTDHLIKLARKTVKSPPQRELDMLLTAGERVSMALLAMSLQEEGIAAISFTGSQSGIVTSSDHTEARILDIRGVRIQEELGKGKVVIIAGFQGVSQEKEITTLGRGGSDTTAIAVAAKLGAAWCEILTDVAGLFTADPRLVPNAHLMEHCNYDEALELASLGAKMHSRSLEVAKRFRVKVRVLSSQGAGAGTRIDNDPPEGSKMETTVIKGIATQQGFHFIRAALTLLDLVELMQAHKIALRYFSYSPAEVRFLCDSEKAEAMEKALTEKGCAFKSIPKVATVSAVGEGLSASVEVLPKFLSVIHLAGAECLLVSANSLSVTAAILANQREGVSRDLHAALINLSDTK